MIEPKDLRKLIKESDAFWKPIENLMNPLNNNQKTKNMRTFILLKDLPNVKAGAEYKSKGDGYPYYLQGVSEDETDYWSIKHVENNPEWFKEKEWGQEPLDLRKLTTDPTSPTYTLEDMRDCFWQSRFTHPLAGFKYDTFEDFYNKNIGVNKQPVAELDGKEADVFAGDSYKRYDAVVNFTQHDKNIISALLKSQDEANKYIKEIQKHLNLSK